LYKKRVSTSEKRETLFFFVFVKTELNNGSIRKVVGNKTTTD